MYPTDEFASLAPGDSMRITFLCTYKLDRNSHVPEGTYWVETVDGKEGSPLPVALKALPLPSPESMSGYPDATKIYESIFACWCSCFGAVRHSSVCKESGSH